MRGRCFLKRINAEEKNYLVERNILKVVRGKIDGLYIANKRNSKSKTFYVEDSYYYILQKRKK
jgi:hypothetical protein